MLTDQKQVNPILRILRSAHVQDREWDYMCDKGISVLIFSVV